MNIKNQLSPLVTFFMVAGHLFFATGLLLLIVYSSSETPPIYLEKSQLMNVLYCFFAGYVFVLIEWIYLVKMGGLYQGSADEVPGYLTQKLYGYHPYLFTFGKTNFSNKNTNIRWHKYNDQDVVNKSFLEIFCIHVNKNFILILVALATLLPYLIVDQTPPSYLKIVQQHFLLYVGYMYLISITWLSSISLLLFRAYLLFK